ncbi:DUF4270 family protein [Cyclobacterium sp. 1_MG-2023]|uniref:DUF4270 family protein n=1 Tax=Cyclobacterium sp. 1_MG-2023 TaxID=3062681 RepID=UPI0026E412A7|nr:DUF4270 family protein [Cyclobacterium sp. 1_MG-2023]MDO6436213.1 DUF4270 family protein [Cyclobacterium sp. 1_MG-2023]
MQSIFRSIKYFCMSALALLMTGCFENDILVQPEVIKDDDQLDVSLIESTDILLYSYFKDSLVTNDRSSFLLGSYEDTIRGKIDAVPYVQFGAESSIQMNDEAQMDSVVLVLFYESFHYDTIPVFDLNIYELLESPEPDDDGDIYNFQTFGYESTPLVSKAIQALPHKDSLTIKLPYQFGLELFEQSKSSSSIFFSNDDLEEYFKGFRIESVGTGPLLTFAETSYIGFYYKSSTDISQTNSFFKITVQSGTEQFTNLTIDKSYGIFQGFEAYTNISSEATSGTLMVDPLYDSGIRIEFPETQSLKEISESFFISSAILHLPVKPGTYNNYFNTPSFSISVYVVDKDNDIIGSLGTVGMTAFDDQFHENTYFEIPVKDFIDSQLSTNYDNGNALWITIPQSTSFTTNYLAFSSHSTTQKIKLDIVFLPLN